MMKGFKSNDNNFIPETIIAAEKVPTNDNIKTIIFFWAP